MYFQDLCNMITNPDEIQISDDEKVPEEFVEPLNVLVDLVRLKVKRASFVKISFVQNKFDDMDKVERILNEQYHGQVYDGLALQLSKRLFGLPFDKISNEEVAIIKVLAIYLMIQPHFNAYN